MGTTPTTDNGIADFIDGFVKAAITGGEQAVQTYVAVQAPFLEAPIIDIFTNAVIDAVGNAIYQQTANLVANVVISVQTNLEKSAASAAIANLRAAQAKGDQDAITKANAGFDAAVGALVHWDGSGNPP